MQSHVEVNEREVLTLFRRKLFAYAGRPEHVPTRVGRSVEPRFESTQNLIEPIHRRLVLRRSRHRFDVLEELAELVGAELETDERAHDPRVGEDVIQDTLRLYVGA